MTTQNLVVADSVVVQLRIHDFFGSDLRFAHYSHQNRINNQLSLRGQSIVAQFPANGSVAPFCGKTTTIELSPLDPLASSPAVTSA